MKNLPSVFCPRSTIFPPRTPPFSCTIPHISKRDYTKDDYHTCSLISQPNHFFSDCRFIHRYLWYSQIWSIIKGRLTVPLVFGVCKSGCCWSSTATWALLGFLLLFCLGQKWCQYQVVVRLKVRCKMAGLTKHSWQVRSRLPLTVRRKADSGFSRLQRPHTGMVD